MAWAWSGMRGGAVICWMILLTLTPVRACASLRPLRTATTSLGNRSVDDAPSRHTVLAARLGGRRESLPMFTCCSLTEGGIRLSACGHVDDYSVVHHRRPHPGSGNSHPGQVTHS